MIKKEVINMIKLNEGFRLLNSEIGNDHEVGGNRMNDLTLVFVSLTRR